MYNNNMSIRFNTNRQINTDPTKQVERKILLEVLEDTSYKDKSFKKGETIEMNKEEAKIVLKNRKSSFRIFN